MAAPHLIHVFPSLEVGGQQVRAVKLANALGRRFRHTFIALNGDFEAVDRVHPEIDSSCLAVVAPKGSRLRPAAIAAFRNLLAAQAPDLLLTYNWGAMEWAFANRFFPLCPHVHFEDGFGPQENPKVQLARRVWFRRVALTGNSIVVVPSLTLRNLATTRWGFAADRVLYVPNGVDCARFARPSAPSRRGPLRIGSVGRLRAEKNYARLLRIFAEAKARASLELEIVGDGPENASLQRLAASLGLDPDVIFFGETDSPEERLWSWDIFALTSDTEQMPFSLLEAMAASLPVVAAAVGDVGAILPPENKPFLFAPSDEAGFLTGLLRLAAEPGLREQLAAANLERVRSAYSEERMIAAYDALFGSMLKGSDRRSLAASSSA